jgi:DNA-binding NarL/FixJ family response regulator
MDYGLSDGTGLEAMQAILAQQPQVKVVFLTIHESVELALEAILHGARGFLVKNIAINKLVAALHGLERGELAVSRSLIGHLVDYLLRAAPHNPWDHPAENKLTRREWEVLKLLGMDASNQEIARRLYISENTVKIHVHNLLDKLKLKDRHDAARYARMVGLVPGVTESPRKASVPALRIADSKSILD